MLTFHCVAGELLGHLLDVCDVPFASFISSQDQKSSGVGVPSHLLYNLLVVSEKPEKLCSLLSNLLLNPC